MQGRNALTSARHSREWCCWMEAQRAGRGCWEGALQPCPAPSTAAPTAADTGTTDTGTWTAGHWLSSSQNPWDPVLSHEFCNQTRHQADEQSGQVLVGIIINQLSKRHHMFSRITCPCSFPCSHHQVCRCDSCRGA